MYTELNLEGNYYSVYFEGSYDAEDGVYVDDIEVAISDDTSGLDPEPVDFEALPKSVKRAIHYKIEDMLREEGN